LLLGLFSEPLASQMPFSRQIFGASDAALWVAKVIQDWILSPCIIFAIYPVMKYAAQRAGGIDGFVIVCIAIHLASRAPLYMAYGKRPVPYLGYYQRPLIYSRIHASSDCSVSPRRGSLSTANSFGQMLASGMRTISPSLPPLCSRYLCKEISPTATWSTIFFSERVCWLCACLGFYT
jgi:hypothetical protein